MLEIELMGAGFTHHPFGIAEFRTMIHHNTSAVDLDAVCRTLRLYIAIYIW